MPYISCLPARPPPPRSAYSTAPSPPLPVWPSVGLVLTRKIVECLQPILAPVTPLLQPPRQDSSGPRPPLAGSDLWGLRGAKRHLSFLPLPAWPTCTSSSQGESPRQGTQSAEAFLNRSREGQVSSFVSPRANTCPPAGEGLAPASLPTLHSCGLFPLEPFPRAVCSP